VYLLYFSCMYCLIFVIEIIFYYMIIRRAKKDNSYRKYHIKNMKRKKINLERHWVSKCLLFNDKWAISAISWRAKVTVWWDDGDVIFVLDQQAELILIFLSV
jgi:hypothetical protein